MNKEIGTINVRLPENLFEGIMLKVEREQKRALRRHFVVRTFLAVASFIALVPAFLYVEKAFAASGFYDFVSLALTDNVAFTAYWKDFVLSVAESLPLIGITACLSAFAVLVWSSVEAFQDGRIFFQHRNVNS